MARVLRLLGVGALVAAAVTAWPGAAGAGGPDQSGWWSKQPLAGAVPVPVGAVGPSDAQHGLYVANDPSGPLAISALRYPSAQPADATLVLQVSQGSTAIGASISACPATGTWDGSSHDFGKAPRYDCNGAHADGVASDTGDSVKWEIPAALQAQSSKSVDIVLVPSGQVPYSLSFDPPVDGVFVQQTPVAAEPTPAAAPSTNTAAAPDTAATTAAESAPAAAFAAPSGTDTASSVEPEPTGTATPPIEAAPNEAQTSTAAAPEPITASGSKVARGQAPKTTKTSDRVQRVLAVAVLAAIGAALWWLGGARARAPRRLGALAGGAGVAVAAAAAPGGPLLRVGGIGRFARPRSALPNRL